MVLLSIITIIHTEFLILMPFELFYYYNLVTDPVYP